MLAQLTINLKPPTTTGTTSKSRSQPSTRMTDIAYYNEYYTLLESLSQISSISIICDLPAAGEMTKEWFRGLFSLIR